MNPNRAALALTWFAVIAYSFAPFDFAFSLGRPSGELAADSRRAADLGLHFLAFAVIGAIHRRLADHRASAPARHFVTGVLLCAGIELVQIFISSRHPQVLDFAVNAGGLVFGHFAAGAPSRRSRVPTASPAFTRHRGWAAMAGWGVVWSAVIFLPPYLAALDVWNPTYALVVGNEKTGDRRWDGRVRYLAFYDRALSREDVGELFESDPGTATGSTVRQKAGLLLGYEMARLSGSGSWLEPEGPLRDPALKLHEGRITSSVGWAEQLSRRIISQGAFTIEVSLEPSTLSQTGPARIVSISEDPWMRNVMLGQEERAIHFRVRNYFTGKNGIRHELVCPDALIEGPNHIVATYYQGLSAVFRNARHLCSSTDLREPSVLLGLGAGPASHVTVGILAALTWIVAAGARRSLVWLLCAGYAWLLALAVGGSLLIARPATSLYVWFGPALVLSWIWLRRMSR